LGASSAASKRCAPNSDVSEVIVMYYLAEATQFAILIIDGMALAIIAIGTVEAFLKGPRVMLSSSGAGHERREVWLQYARWLVAGLSFQLAADILATSVAPNRDELVRLAVVAAIRVFLNLFLEKDLSEVRVRQTEPAGDRVDPA
jgi:uncharacterized membrane protein